MENSEMLWIATRYNSKGYSQEQMRDGDDCYHLKGKEGDDIKNKISDYMDEISKIGTITFYEKYKEYKLF